MIALSRSRGLKLTIRQGRREFHKTPEGEIPEMFPEIAVRFEPIPGLGPGKPRGMKVPYLLDRDGEPDYAEGQLNVEEAADKAGISVDELVFWLLRQGRYGTRGRDGFVLVTDNKEVVRDLDDWMMNPIEPPEGKTGNWFRCRVCDREMDSRGVNGHRKSPAHSEGLASYRQQLRAKIYMLGRQREEYDSVASF